MQLNSSIFFIKEKIVNYPKAFLLVWLLIFVIHTSSDQALNHSIIKIRQYPALLKQWERSMADNDYLQLWYMLSPNLQRGLTELTLLLKNGNYRDLVALSSDLKIDVETIALFFSPYAFFWGLEKAEVELTKIFMQKKQKYFQSLYKCADFFYIPDLSFIAAGILGQKRSISSLKSLAFLSSKDKDAIKFLYYVCPGYAPLGLTKINEGDWRLDFGSW
jgi:hypothetical protein